jgi:hypothetical protein
LPAEAPAGTRTDSRHTSWRTCSRTPRSCATALVLRGPCPVPRNDPDRRTARNHRSRTRQCGRRTDCANQPASKQVAGDAPYSRHSDIPDLCTLHLAIDSASRVSEPDDIRPP